MTFCLTTVCRLHFNGLACARLALLRCQLDSSRLRSCMCSVSLECAPGVWYRHVGRLRSPYRRLLGPYRRLLGEGPAVESRWYISCVSCCLLALLFLAHDLPVQVGMAQVRLADSGGCALLHSYKCLWHGVLHGGVRFHDSEVACSVCRTNWHVDICTPCATLPVACTSWCLSSQLSVWHTSALSFCRQWGVVPHDCCQAPGTAASICGKHTEGIEIPCLLHVCSMFNPCLIHA